ncbi:hypothetical protein GH714_040573 [Hevea brasiliensis]|uniref:GDSL esterase/lipase n=1 Tax=Hevea brasiliensis TaxID=3981 RepID=A0A6A6KX71_HEVBR|nr:hypothetical protein GH714_040573 [Hevea brasiliensis]
MSLTLHNGSTFFQHSTNRYYDGRLVIDFVAEALSLPYLPPFRRLKGKSSDHGVNFAVAGSTAIYTKFFVKNNIRVGFPFQSIQNQIIWFNKFLEKQGCKGPLSSSPQCKALLEDALIWVGELGANDYAYACMVKSSVSDDTVRKLAISSAIASMQVALLQKVMKYVVVPGLPPTGCLPLALSMGTNNDKDDIGCVKSVNDQSSTHNAVCQAKLQHLMKQFPAATIAYLDYWNA